jgi:hypothetical protein
MAGTDFRAAEFAHTLRTNLFAEHFGLKESEVQDPLDDDMWDTIKRNSKVIV